ncbi:MAG: 3-dehydroquinate synthase [Candidatus Handelsmanbacteria bacterium]|nr:3-dehydroquinate synthase [Candidatus Handelsmanbacteria bacterium]
MQTIALALEPHPYAIHVGHGVLSRLGALCREAGLGRQVALVTDHTVAGLHLAPAAASLREAGFAVTEVRIAGTDAAKHLRTAEEVFGRLIEAGLDRRAWVLALGGGVVGDLAGFVAATFLRGIPFVQVPTTIVSQVDASIGGKTGVNHPLGKNMIGAFHQPRLVCIDTALLRTLPRRELVAGMAEVVKHALIRDAELFSLLERDIERIVGLELSPDELDQLIAANARIKAEVVAADEKESELRALLNYGHTIGHAIESASQYGYLHGEAVILGMIGAGELAVQRGMWPAPERQRQDALLARLGIPAGLSRLSADLIVERTRADKKRLEGRHRFVLPRRIGQVEIIDGISDGEVQAAVAYIQHQHP